jgi:hypothetical protein
MKKQEIIDRLLEFGSKLNKLNEEWSKIESDLMDIEANEE